MNNQMTLTLADASTATITMNIDHTRTIKYNANGAVAIVPVGCVINIYSVQRVYDALCGKN